MGQSRRYKNWFNSANKPSGTEHIVSPADFTPLLLTWRVKQRPKLLIFSRFIVQRSPCGCETGSRAGWTASWKDIDRGVPLPYLKSRDKNLPTSWIAVQWHTDLPQAYGQAPWLPESLKMSFPLPTMPLMFPVSSTILGSPSSVPKRYWPKPIWLYNPDGFATNIPTSKKSEERRSRRSLRGRSELPAGPHPLSDVGTVRGSARDTDYGTEEYPENLWHHRTVLRKIPLSFSGNIQCRNIHHLSGKNFKVLFPTKSLPDTGQCILPQRQGRLDLVFRSSETCRGVQSPCVLSRTQCTGKNMASHSSAWNAQSLFYDPGRTSLSLDFNVSEHSKKSFSGYGVPTTVSIMHSINNIM